MKVFLDANVYFAGAMSSEGASAMVLKLAKMGKIEIFANHLVLLEAERNLAQKADQKILERFHHDLQQIPIHMIHSVEQKVLVKYQALINFKDAPILAAAVETGIDYLITLDRRHFLVPKILSHSPKIKILTPGDFLKEFFKRYERENA